MIADLDSGGLALVILGTPEYLCHLAKKPGRSTLSSVAWVPQNLYTFYPRVKFRVKMPVNAKPLTPLPQTLNPKALRPRIMFRLNLYLS